MALSFTDQSNETIFVVEKFGRKNKITPKRRYLVENWKTDSKNAGFPTYFFVDFKPFLLSFTPIYDTS